MGSVTLPIAAQDDKEGDFVRTAIPEGVAARIVCHQTGQKIVDVAAGAGFRSLTEAIDTTTPAGRMMMQMVGAFAEFERAMIRERTRAGLAAARAEGRVGGRRSKLTPDQRADVVENVTSGRRSAAQMARLYKVSEATVSRIMAAARQSHDAG